MTTNRCPGCYSKTESGYHETWCAVRRQNQIRFEPVALGLSSGLTTNIGPQVTATISTTCHRRCVLDTIEIADASFFRVLAVSVGVEYLIEGPLPGTAFPAAPLYARPVEVGMDLSITVTNLTNARRRFSATALGRSLGAYETASPLWPPTRVRNWLAQFLKPEEIEVVADMIGQSGHHEEELQLRALAKSETYLLERGRFKKP